MWPVGKRISIQWRAPLDQRPDVWVDFILLGALDGWVSLQGVEAEDCAPYDGGPIFVPLSAIELIEVVE
jgi:hypothetical protein